MCSAEGSFIGAHPCTVFPAPWESHGKMAALLCITREDHSGTTSPFIRGALPGVDWHVSTLLCWVIMSDQQCYRNCAPVRLDILVKGSHIIHLHTLTLIVSIKVTILKRNQSNGGITCAPLEVLYFLLYLLPASRKQNLTCTEWSIKKNKHNYEADIFYKQECQAHHLV